MRINACSLVSFARHVCSHRCVGGTGDDREEIDWYKKVPQHVVPVLPRIVHQQFPSHRGAQTLENGLSFGSLHVFAPQLVYLAGILVVRAQRLFSATFSSSVLT